MTQHKSAPQMRWIWNGLRESPADQVLLKKAMRKSERKDNLKKSITSFRKINNSKRPTSQRVGILEKLLFEYWMFIESEGKGFEVEDPQCDMLFPQYSFPLEVSSSPYKFVVSHHFQLMSLCYDGVPATSSPRCSCNKIFSKCTKAVMC